MIALPMRLRRFFVFLRQTLTIPDVADQQAVIDYVRSDAEFRGAKAWILILAVLVASLGLNVNSTAVIIGAMLISPLMGPIIGLGVAVGVTDRQMFFRSLRHLATATALSLVASTLYFMISPFDQAESELLARTTPTLLDALIAITGGAAGAIAMVRLDKSNVVPGVAIATALMPPLCTAGFAVSQLNLEFFLGAFYLFFINSVLIAVSTFAVVRLLKFDHVQNADVQQARRNVRLIWAVVVITLIPSVYTGWNMLRRQAFATAIKNFTAEASTRYPSTSFVVSRSEWHADTSNIVLTLVGKELTDTELSNVRGLAQHAGLTNVQLDVVQSRFTANLGTTETDPPITANELRDLLRHTVADLQRTDSILAEQIKHHGAIGTEQLVFEVMAFDPDVSTFDLAGSTAYATYKRRPTPSQITKLQSWLRIRLSNDSLHVQPVIL
jgi:uncharacterized hydrophobic protein (TIGR00271 family)